jgi:hypothetical protein
MVFHHKGKDVAVLTTTETVEEPPLGIDRKGRRFFTMEGAEPRQAGSGPFQLNVFADNLNDIGCVLDNIFYVITGRWNTHPLLSHRLFPRHFPGMGFWQIL